MGRRGPLPTPSRINEARGNPGRRPRNKREARPELCKPTQPKFKNQEARIEWKRDVPEYSKWGLVTTLSAAALQRTFERLDDYWTLRKQIRKEGWTFVSKGAEGQKYIKRNPAVGMLERAWKDYIDGKRGFGGDPASLTRIEVASGEKEEDPFAEFDSAPLRVVKGGKR